MWSSKMLLFHSAEAAQRTQLMVPSELFPCLNEVHQTLFGPQKSEQEAKLQTAQFKFPESPDFFSFA